MSRLSNPVTRYTDDSGSPLIDGVIYFYESGTSTLADTYADSAQTILNTNPVPLSAAGELPNVFFTGTLKAVLRDSTQQYWERDPVTSGTGGSLVTDWDALVTYDASDIVRYGIKYYISLLNNNINKIPGAEALYWATYPNGDIVCDSVTSDEFIGLLTGNADTATLAATATNSLSLGGNLASEYLPDFQSNRDTAISVPTDTPTVVATISLGTVNAGSVIMVSGNVRWNSINASSTAQIKPTGTATFNINGYVGGTSDNVIRAVTTGGLRVHSISALVNVTVSGTLTIDLNADQTSGGSVTVAAAQIATAYLIKKA